MWDDFRLSSNDEFTINNTLCVNGLFQIASSQEVDNHPKVHAAVQSSKIFVAVDQSLVLIENENVGECKFLSFEETQIDCVFISESGKLVVCCLTNGNINGFCINGNPLFSLKVNEEDVGQDRTFVGISSWNQDLYIMCTSGRMYKVGSVDEDRSENGIENNDTLVFDETISSNAHLIQISSRKFYNEIFSFVIIPQISPPMAVFNDCNHIYVYSIGNDTLLPLPVKNVKKLHIFKQYLLGLCENGDILEICPFTGMIYNMSKESDCRIDDMVLLESTGDKIELMVLTKANQIRQKMLKVVEFPTMRSLYDLDMSEHIWLVEQPKSSMGMYYLVGNILEDRLMPQEIEMKIISETLPEHQLKKMIYRGLLDEAEHFAVQFNLNVQPIYECRISQQVAGMVKCRNTEELRELLTAFLQLLDKIDNPKILLDLWNIEIPDRQMTAEFLEYILEKVSNEDEGHRDVKYKIAEYLRRIETLNLMDPSDSLLEWRKFLSSQNLLKVCVEYFSSSISKACLIWSRHSSHLIPKLDTKGLMKILNSFPSTVEPLSVIQWLHHFTPSLLQIHPEFMSIIVDWSIVKIRFYESTVAWKNNTLEICNSILEIFTNLHFIIADPRRQYDSNVRKLQVLKFALENLKILKNDYNVVIGLSDYLGNSLEDTTFKLLLGVQTDKIESLINDFIYPNFMEVNKSPIETLARYINFLITYRKSFCYWQDRAVIALELIPDEDERLQCTQNVLREAPVPWSPVLMPLIKYSCLNHPLAQEIRSIYDQRIVKMIKLKYHWPQNAPDDYLMLICRILKEKTSEMWSDIKSLIKTVPQIEKMAYYCCIHELTKQENFEIILHILEELGDNGHEIIQYLMERFIEMLEDGMENEKKFIQILNILNKKSNHSMGETVEQINRLYALKDRFENQFINLRINDLSDTKTIFDKGMNIIVNNLRNYGDNLIFRLWNDVKILTAALKMDFLAGIIDLAHKCSNLQLSCALAYDIIKVIEITSDNCDKLLEFCALLLVQQTQVFESEDEIFKDTLTFPIIYRFLAKILQVTKVYYLEAKEMVVWIRICNEFYNDSDLDEYYEGKNKTIGKDIAQIFMNNHATLKELKTDKKRISMSIFDQVLSPTTQVAKEVKLELQYIIKCISTIMRIVFHHPEGLTFGYRLQGFIKLYDGTLEDEEFHRLKGDLSEHIQKLFKLKMYSTLYTIALQIIELQKKCGFEIIPEVSVKLFHAKLLKSSLSERQFNSIECLAQLLSSESPEKFVYSLDISPKNDTVKLNYYTLMENYYNICGNKEKALHERENRIKYQIISEIRKKKPDFRLSSKLESMNLEQVIKEVCTVPINVASLKKLFGNLSWEGDYQDLLVSQLLLVLRQQELKFDMVVDEFGKEKITVHNSVEDILMQCRPYMDEILREELLLTKLIGFMSTMNFYFYEMYISIIEILTEFKILPVEMGMWKTILEFLKHKMTVRRRTKITQEEGDLWLQAQSDGGMLPKISKYRFPFKVIIKNDLHKILGDEIHVDNCKDWFPLIKIHTLYFYKEATIAIVTEITEKFCMTAIKNSMAEYKAHTERGESDTWQLKPTDNSMLKSIIKLTQFMSTEWKIFSVLYYVTNYTADGVDQVEAAYECYKYAMENEKKLIVNEAARDKLIKIKRKYPMIKIQHLLHVHKLNEENLLNLVENPIKLIHTLYLHETILKPQPANVTHVVEEIATLHALDLRVIQVNLLTKWLSISVDTNESNPDETLLLDNLEEDKCLNPDNDVDDSVKRAQYILQSWPEDEAVQFLITISHQNPQNPESELRIFEWMVQLLDDESTESRSVIAQKNYVQMKVTSDLKKLGFNLPPAKYNSYDKISLLKMIWQKNGNNPAAVHAMALICLEFDINEYKIWDVILRRMVHFDMRKELLSIVNFLSTKQELLAVDGLRVAWEWLIRAPFEKASRATTSRNTEELYRSLTLLQTCPITSKINLVNLAHLCVHIDQVHMAAILMVYVSKEDRTTIKNLVLKHKSPKMQDQLEELELQGILPVLIKNATTEIFHMLD